VLSNCHNEPDSFELTPQIISQHIVPLHKCLGKLFHNHDTAAVKLLLLMVS